jgi:hypothetical protein
MMKNAGSSARHRPVIALPRDRDAQDDDAQLAGGRRQVATTASIAPETLTARKQPSPAQPDGTAHPARWWRAASRPRRARCCAGPPREWMRPRYLASTTTSTESLVSGRRAAATFAAERATPAPPDPVQSEDAHLRPGRCVGKRSLTFASYRQGLRPDGASGGQSGVGWFVERNKYDALD